MKMSIKCLKETLNKIYKNYDNDDAFCLSILENNEMKYSFCKGNLNNKKIVNINTKFNIGSISKMFVVIIILKMVNQKLIQLDDPVVNYFPDFRMKDSRYIYITIRMLLNHSAGLEDSASLDYVGYAYNNIKSKFLKNLQNQNLCFLPGEKSIYCDDGFFLAQLLIEKVYKDTFLNCIEKFVDLKAIGPSIGELKDKSNVFYKNENTIETISVQGIAGLSANVLGLCKFGNKILNDNILSRSEKDMLFEPQKEYVSKAYSEINSFGLGWDNVFKINGKKTFLKKGYTSQYQSFLLIIPEENIVISSFTSNTNNKIDISAILKALFNIPKKKKYIFNNQLLNSDDFEGIYFNKRNLYKIKYDNNIVITDFNDNHIILNLTPTENNNIFIDDSDDRYCYYFKNINQKIYFIKYDYIQEHNMILLEKLIVNKKPCKNDIDNCFNEKLWFRNSCFFYEILYSKKFYHMVKPHIIKSEVHNNFILFDGLKYRDGNKLIPVDSCFDKQQTINLSNCNNVIECSIFGKFYSSENNITKLKNGLNTIFLKKYSYIRWVYVDFSCKINIDIPTNVRVFVFDNKTNLIYDSFLKKEKTCFLESKSQKFYIEIVSNGVSSVKIFVK